jgi:hypothetical protein
VNTEPSSEENLSPWQRWKQNLGETRPWDMLNPNSERASEEVAKSRFEQCLSCEFLLKPTNQCKKCGCLMHLKTKLAAAKCPVGHW